VAVEETVDGSGDLGSDRRPGENLIVRVLAAIPTRCRHHVNDSPAELAA
jgi:hypothetical protein